MTTLRKLLAIPFWLVGMGVGLLGMAVAVAGMAVCVVAGEIEGEG